jgi:hypothetical protein
VDEQQLEQVMRTGLRERAGHADTSAPVRQRVTAVHPRRRGWYAMAAAAAAVVAVVAAGVALSGGDGPSRNGEPIVGSPGTTGWRTEYWHDMRVDVPGDWGYGSAPMRSAGETVACWPTAMVDADGHEIRHDDPTLPYVGRPIAMTDLCRPYPFNAADALPPQAPYVWLGADVDTGTVDLGDGWVQQTVDVNGSRLTVASDDARLRQQILDSAGGGETCMSEVEPDAGTDVFPRYQPGNPDDIESMDVCAYRLREDHPRFALADLVYATTVGRQAARDYLEAMALGEPGRDVCPTADVVETEWVVLEMKGGDGETIRRDVVHLACPGVDVGGQTLTRTDRVPLTPDLVRPWAVGGVRAVIYGPNGGKGAMLDSFIGPLG